MAFRFKYCFGLIGPYGRTEAQIGPLPISPQLLISSPFPLHTSFRIFSVLLNIANVNLFAIRLTFGDIPLKF